eukprot:gb/GEZN01001521.1/.p1 GENE.gb/GEZN01001521.1/~~gb/GEZN01001521.1/.p1  ORF type:complete len:954 (-),score=161.87 gb/GEZN01001521.1/:137-2947(-)
MAESDPGSPTHDSPRDSGEPNSPMDGVVSPSKPKPKICPQCNGKFGLTRWRWVCRQCGDWVCSDCAPNKTWDRFDKPMRVCGNCRSAWGTDGKKGGGVALPDHLKQDKAKFRTKFGVNDMVLLDDISNQGIVDCLESHYQGDEIYVYIGQVLVSVNPFKTISGLYSSSNLEKYKGKNFHQNTPHVYAVAESAYRRMVRDLTKECVIISGESGAGKTEASKKVMEYIAAISGKAKEVQTVKEKLLESNPFLEAFGNAKTIRNNNSSRFGKYMEIQFDIGDPVGGKILVFLLEKNRVLERQKTERSFHVFYQLLSGASDSEKQHLELAGKGADKFRYLSCSECYTIQGIDDKKEFKETRDAMDVIGLGADWQSLIFSVLAAILHLGNIEFSGGRDGCVIDSKEHLDSAAKLLGVTKEALIQNLTNRSIQAGSEKEMTKPMGKIEAQHARDAFSKGMYGRLFKWLVKMANTSIYTEFYSNLIGVLDIYGFEIFGVNQFEQLCINYVNEKLHQLFIELTLKSEQDEYRKEGIPWEDIKYYNNLEICTLIDGRGKIFDLLNEESIFPNGTDTSLYTKLKAQLGKDRNYQATSGKEFMIRHYAGEVSYTVEGMLDKNKDLLFTNVLKLCATESSNKLLKELFEDEFKIQSKKRPDTSCVQFKTQVKTLMTTLGSCNQHYIRCIKTNENKAPKQFDQKLVFTQVTYLGLLENVTVRRAGYAMRVPFDKFLSKYKVCSKAKISVTDDEKDSCAALLKSLGKTDFLLGKTKIFIRSPKTLFELEDLRADFLDKAQSFIPNDQLVFADSVMGYDQQAKVALLVIIAANNCYLLRDGKIVMKVSTTELQGLTVGDKVDGFLIMHCKEELDQKELAKKTPREARYWNVVLENVFKQEVINVVTLLKTAGVDIDLRRQDVSLDPDTLDSRFKPEALKGTTNTRDKCVIS